MRRISEKFRTWSVVAVAAALAACSKAESAGQPGGKGGGQGGGPPAMPVEVAVARTDTVVDAILATGQV